MKIMLWITLNNWTNKVLKFLFEPTWGPPSKSCFVLRSGHCFYSLLFFSLQKLAEKLGIQVSVSDEMNKLLSIKKVEEIQRMDRFPTQGVYGLPAVSCKFAPFFVSGKSKKKLATPALSQTSNLPPEAMQLLKNRLDSCQARKEAAVTSTARKRKKNGEINAAGDCSKSSKSFELNKTMTNYWILHINPWKTTSSEVAEFDVHLTKLFPNSFVWLLRECCFLLDCKITDLYREICDVEDLLLGKDLPWDNVSQSW